MCLQLQHQDFTPIPSAIRWATIIGQLWEQQAADPSNLSLIWRYQIANETTQHLINVALQNGVEKTEFTPSDEQFFALLANDNGRVVVHLLRHWCRTLGRKTIMKIKVLRLKEPAMCFVLEPTELPDAGVTPSRQRKKHGRHSSFVTNRRPNTSDSSERAIGGSTVYQMNSRQVSKGNAVGTNVSVCKGMNVLYIRRSVVQCEQRLKLAFLQ